MAGMITVRYDAAAVQAVEKQLRGIPNAMASIMSPALNRTADWCRTRMKREVAAQCRLKAGRADRLLKTDKASPMKWNARVEIENRRVPIGRFVAARGRRARVTAHFPSGLAQSYPRSFYAKMPTGHGGVYVRGRVVKPGVAVRRVEHVGKRGQRRGWYKYTSELPIYEQRERLGAVMRMDWLAPLAREGQARLSKEIAYKLQWLLHRHRLRRIA